MIVCTGDTLQIDPDWLKSARMESDFKNDPRPLAELERRTILEALNRCRGRIYGPAGAAAALGLKPTTLYGKMRKHQIKKRSSSD
jgi:formate hydrogenlyase transcriptional activator